MSAFIQHFTFEFKTGLRNSTQLLMHYLFPLGFFALMGVVMTAINPLWADTMIPAIIVFGAMASILLALPATLVEARTAGIFRTYKINGVPAINILAVPALTDMLHVIVMAAIVALAAGPLFGGTAPQNWAGLALVTIVTAAALAGLAALVGVIAQNTGATVLWSQLVFLPSILLGGVMMPLSALPASILPIARLFPATNAMQAFDGLAYGRDTLLNPWLALGALAVSAVLSFALAVYLFNWDERNDTRRGHPALALLALAPYVVTLLFA